MHSMMMRYAIVFVEPGLGGRRTDNRDSVCPEHVLQLNALGPHPKGEALDVATARRHANTGFLQREMVNAAATRRPSLAGEHTMMVSELTRGTGGGGGGRQAGKMIALDAATPGTPRGAVGLHGCKNPVLDRVRLTPPRDPVVSYYAIAGVSHAISALCSKSAREEPIQDPAAVKPRRPRRASGRSFVG